MRNRRRRQLPGGHRPYKIPGDDPFFGSEDVFKDLPGYAEGEVVTVIGPLDGNFQGPPLMRQAELDDFEHDCSECRKIRRRIRAGEKVMVADFSKPPK
jgi:hypothetical protein